MATRSIKKITPIQWVPPIYTANWKVTVERADSSIDDISDIITHLKIEDGVTEGIGIFEFELHNPNETYTNAWTGMEIFRYYCDYAGGEPTTLRFRGRIEKPSNKENMLKVTGRSETLFVHDQTVNKNYEAADGGTAIKDLFDTYGQSRFDVSEISTSTGRTITLTFNDVPFWDAVEAICLAIGYDCYVNANLVVKFFEAGSQLNTTEGIVHDYNLVEVGDFAPDLQFIRNQIRVTGGIIDGVQVIYTANDTASQTLYGIRRDSINDDGIVTFEAAKDLAEFELSNRKDIPTIGEVRGLHLATIQPGENMRISSPTEGINPGNYRTIKYKLEIEDGMGYTTVTINKEPKKISHVIKDRIQREHKKTDAGENPEDLDFSDIELFNADTGTHSGTAISGGVLKPTGSSGIWISSSQNTADGNTLDKMRISLVGDDLSNVDIKVSTDDGLSYTDFTRDALVTGLSNKKFIIRLELGSANAQVDSLRVQYSTT